MFIYHVANAVNFLFLMLVTLCLVVGFLVAMQGGDEALQEVDREAFPLEQVHTNGTGRQE